MTNSVELGYRYVIRDGNCLWVHHLELRPSDIDATDMTDDELLQALEGGAE